MIRYRTRETTRSLYPVLTSAIGYGGYCLMLPTSTSIYAPDADGYQHCFDGDDITTSVQTNFAGDHECSHNKVEATIEGKVILSGKTDKAIGYGQYVGDYYSANTGYDTTWVYSSGSGPRFSINGSSTRVGPIMGPGILSEASCILSTHRHADGKNPGMQTLYSKIVQIADDSYALISCQCSVIRTSLGTFKSGSIDYTIRTYVPVLNTSTTWKYAMVIRDENSSTSSEICQAYLYDPEVYWSSAIADSLKRISALVKPVQTSNRLFYDMAHSYRVTAGGVSSSVVRKIAKQVRKYSDTAIISLDPPSNNTWSDLCVASLQCCQELDINSIAYAKDLIEFKQEIQSVKDIILGWKNPRSYLKAFLEYKYGARLTVSDTKKIVSSVRSFVNELQTWNKSYSVVKSVSSDYPCSNYRACSGFSRTYHYKVYYSPADSRVLDCIRTLMNWDVWPTLENDWDLIPMSFIVDWFVGVSDLCDRLDAITYSKYLDVFSVLRSTKLVGDVSVDLSSYGIDNVRVVATKYNRTYSSYLDLPSFRLDLGSGFLTHIPEASAIIALLRH